MIFLNVKKVREDFPVFEKKLNGKDIIYFDNACMSMKPNYVIDKINEYYREYPACGLRSLHKLANRANQEVVKARDTVRKFFNARKVEEIAFMKNTTEGINLIANSVGLEKGDVVLGTDKEHNSNLIPWLSMKEKGIVHKVVNSDDENLFDFSDFEEKLNSDVKLVAVGQTSNLDGTSIPVNEVIKAAHDNGSLVLLDGAQSAPHKKVDLKKLDVDFFACSGHKMLAPTGIGMLYGKEDLMKKMNPMIYGGETVIDSTYDGYDLEHIPGRFEAGLQHYAGMIGFGAAVEYLSKIGIDNITEQEHKVNKVMTDGVKDIDGINIIGPVDPKLRGGILSFTYKQADIHNIAMIMDESFNVMMRSGAHCVHSWFNKHNMNGSVRASTYLYNTEEEAKVFVEGFEQITKFL